MFLVKNKKSPNYQIVFFRDGKRSTKSTGTSNKVEAYLILDQFLNHGSPSLHLQSIEVQEPVQTKSISISKFKEGYITFCKPTKSEKYIRSIEYSFCEIIKFAGDIPLNEINLKLLDNFITTIFSRSSSSAHLYYRTLKAAFTKAVSWEYIDENPFKKIKFPKIQKCYPVFISEEELKVILSFTYHQHLEDIFTTAFYTGMRLSEIINMKWNWIDLENNLITVKISTSFRTKSNIERIIPMNQKVKQVILNRNIALGNVQKDEFVFCRIRGKKLHGETVSKQFKQAVRKAKLNDKIHFHTLRHSFASLLVQRGISLYVVKELLGHEDLSTTQIYSHLQSQNLKDAVNMI